MQTPSTRSLVRKLEMELAFDYSISTRECAEWWYRQLRRLTRLKGLDTQSGRLVINLLVDSPPGWLEDSFPYFSTHDPIANPTFVCRNLVATLSDAFMEIVREGMPKLDTSCINISPIMELAWCDEHEPEGITTTNVPSDIVYYLHRWEVLDLESGEVSSSGPCMYDRGL
jgi:hypothetical protein